jgi:ABC-type transport system involved in cytochrome c biogenesis ATPase subunit
VRFGPSGHVELFGGDPWHDAPRLHGRLAYVAGDVALWAGLPGGECLGILGATHGRVDEHRRAGLVERFELDPTKRVRDYSKGNRQKVALVAALAADAELLLLDEPTSGLGPLREQAFQQCIRDRREAGVTVLLSSHIMGEVEALADRVSIIRRGRTVTSGTLAELVLAGLAVAVYGLRPQMFGIAWVGYAVMTLIAFLGPGLKLPQWLLDLSPTTHVDNSPAGAIQTQALTIMAAVAAILIATGFVAFRRRGVPRSESRTSRPPGTGAPGPASTFRRRGARWMCCSRGERVGRPTLTARRTDRWLRPIRCDPATKVGLPARTFRVFRLQRQTGGSGHAEDPTHEGKVMTTTKDQQVQHPAATPRPRGAPQESIKVQGKALAGKVTELLHEGNVRRIVVKNDEGHIVMEIPVTAGVIAAVALPIVTAVGALAALANDWKIEVHRKEAE